MDFPAAHSMDTDWFAVDEDGFVALFSSGENGAVPDSFQGDAYAAQDKQPATVPPRYSRGQVGPSFGRHETWRRFPITDLLMFVDDLEPLQPWLGLANLLGEGDAITVGADTGRAVWFKTLTKDDFDQLHQTGVCKGCTHIWRGAADLVPPWFEYDQVTDSGAARPYGRILAPRQPLHIDAAHPEVAELARGTVLPVRFTEALRVQPMEYVPCRAWGWRWVDYDGVEQPTRDASLGLLILHGTDVVELPRYCQDVDPVCMKVLCGVGRHPVPAVGPARGHPELPDDAKVPTWRMMGQTWFTVAELAAYDWDAVPDAWPLQALVAEMSKRFDPERVTVVAWVH